MVVPAEVGTLEGQACWARWLVSPSAPVDRLFVARHAESECNVKGLINADPSSVSIYERMLAGTVNTMSVGFIGEGRIEPDGVGVITKAELLEVSLTPIPSNIHAVVETVKNKRPDPNDPAVVNRLIDEAADRKKVINDEDRRAADEFILSEKLAAVQRFLEQDEQRRWEQQVATLALNLVTVRVDARMRPVIPEQPSP